MGALKGSLVVQLSGSFKGPKFNGRFRGGPQGGSPGGSRAVVDVQSLGKFHI